MKPHAFLKIETREKCISWGDESTVATTPWAENVPKVSVTTLAMVPGQQIFICPFVLFKLNVSTRVGFSFFEEHVPYFNFITFVDTIN